jgi:uncharacterized protein YqhQ
VAKKFYYGGQAVMEGVMMRGRKTMVTVVRRPDGNLAMDTQSLSGIYSGRWRQTPFIRGVIILIESMVLGIKSLFFSANVSLEEENTELSGWTVWLLVAVSVGLAVVVFFLAPTFLTRLITQGHASSLLFNLVESLIRIIIFILYLKLVSLLPDIKRVFAYHGAEHKVVNALEAGVPLELEAVRQYSTAHVRCSTSFLFVVMIVAILVFFLVGLPSFWMIVLSRIVLMPVIAGISYELIFFGNKHTDNVIVRSLLSPGLWLQKLTTRKPDDRQLEVALAALRKVVELDLAVEQAEVSPPATDQAPAS